MTTAVRGRFILAVLALALAPMPHERAVAPAEGKIAFEENVGQAAPGARFLGRADGYDVLVEPAGATIRLATGDLRLALPGSKLEGADPLPETVSYFPGPSGIATYGSIAGSGLTYRGAGRRLTIEMTVPADVDPASIRLGVEGADTLAIDPGSGDLVMTVHGGGLRIEHPEMAGFVLRGASEFGFLVPDRYHGTELVLGMRVSAAPAPPRTHAPEHARLATDRTGSAYVSGPVAGGGAFVTKIAADGVTRLFTAYLGGMDPHAIAVDPLGRAVLAGREGGDAFVAQLAANGESFVYATRLPGGEARAVDVASDGSVWIAGGRDAGSFVAHLATDGTLLATSTIPGSAEAIRVDGDSGVVVAGSSSRDAFVARFDATATLVSSTTFGGSGDDAVSDVSIDRSGTIRVAGTTSSTDLAPAVATGSGPLFVAILSGDGKALSRVARLPGRSSAPFAGGTDGTAWIAGDGATLRLSPDGRVLDRVSAPTEVTGLALTPRGSAALAGIAEGADPVGALALERSPSGATVFAVLSSPGPGAPEAAGCPGTIHFTNGAGTGLWQTAANWDLNRLPTTTDDVCIPATFAVTLSSGTPQSINTLWVDSASTLTVSTSASLSMAASSQINGALSLNNGTLAGTGDITTNGTFSWGIGTVTGAAALVANGGIQFVGTGAHDITASRAVTTNGLNTTWSGTGTIRVGSGGSITNNGTWDCQSDATVVSLGAPASITNAATGTFKKSAGAGATAIGITFNNAGTTAVQSGTLNLTGGGTGSASFTGTAGTTLQFGGAYTLGASSIVNANGVSFTTGIVGISGSYTAAATTISGGTAGFDTPSPALTTTLTHSSGTIQGAGTLTVSGATSWSGGTMTGAGTVNANGGLTLTGTAVRDVTAGRVLNVSATTTWTGTGAIRVGTSGTITNNGTWDCQSDASIQALGTPGPFTNPSGSIFKKSAGAGTMTIGIPFNSAGGVTIQSGTLTLSGGGSLTGALSGSPSTTLRFGGATFNLGAASSINADSVVFDAGTVNVDGTYTAAATTIAGANTTFDPSCTLTAIGSPLTISSGSVDFSSGETVAPATMSLSGGSLQGSDTVTVSGLTTWTAGAMTGAATVNANGGMTISGTAVHDLTGSRVLNVSGTTTWSGTGPIRIGTGGTITNNGTWDCQSDSMIQTLGTPGPFTNAPGATFKKSAGAMVTAVGIPFNGAGAVTIQSGTISFGNGGSVTGAVTGSASTTLRFGGGTFNLGAASSVSVPTVNFDGGTVNVDGGYSASTGTAVAGGTANFDPSCTLTAIGTALTISNGTANLSSGDTVAPATLTLSGGSLQGSDTVTVSGTTSWTAGTMTGAGTVNANGGITISGTGVHDLTSSRLLNTAGTTTWTGTGPVRLGTGGAITNNGTWDVQSDNSLQSLGTPGNFRNVPLSTFKKSGGLGTLSVGVPFNVERSGGNAATVNVLSGTLSVAGGGTGSGIFTGAAGTTFAFGSGTYTLDGASSFTADSVSVSGALVVDGSYTASSGTSLVSGALTFDPFSTLTAIGSALTITTGTATFTSGETVAPVTFTMSGGTLQGSDTINVSGAASWSGGTMTGAGTVNTNGGMTIAGTGVRDLTSSRLLNTGGLTTWSGTGPIRLGSGGAITNTGTWDDQVDGLIQNLSGAGSFSNNGGTFKKSAGAGMTSISVPFANAAGVESQSGTLQFNAGYAQTAGSTKLNGGAITSSSTMDIQAGTFTGVGTATGNVTSTSAHAAPGLSLGALAVAGNYAQAATGHFDVEIGGLTVGTQYDQLNLTGSGAATLAGTLNVSLANGFVPVSGNSFTVMTYASRSGTFATTNLPALPAGCWLPTYNPTALVLQVITGAQEVFGVGAAPDKSTVSWSPLPPQAGPAATYDLMRGLMSQFPVGGQPGETCLISGTSATSFSDATTPAVGTGFYYLVRGTNSCGRGDYGSRTGGIVRNVTVCP